MALKSKKSIALTSLFFSVLYILLFLIYYVCNYLVNREALFYVSSFIYDFANALLPMLMTVTLLVIYSERGRRAVFLPALFITLPSLLYALPSCYLDAFATLNSTEFALLLAAIESLLILGALYLELLVLLFVLVYATKIASRKKKGYTLPSALSEGGAFDFDKPLTVGVFAAASVTFVKSLVNQIYYTATYDYASAFRLEDIILMLVEYVFILVTLLAVQLLSFLYKKRLVK